MPEFDATDHVHDLADGDAFSTAIADRLDDNGFETIADLLIADRDDLTAVPYVGGQRADEILAAVDAVEPAPEPRAVDLGATESVVREAAIPLSVRRGEAVLVSTGDSGCKVYHTRACGSVRGSDKNLSERDVSWADHRDLPECQRCADPAALGRDESPPDDPEPLVDSREVVLEAALGDKLELTMADRAGYANLWAVVDTEEPTTWEAPTGDTWQTRRIRISKKRNGDGDDSQECDLVVAADAIRLEDPPVKRRSAQPDAPSWRVESVSAVGRVATSTYAQLQSRHEQREAKPEGDDTWREYQRGEA